MPAGITEGSNDFFVLPPSDVSPIREDRPPAVWSLARIVITILVTTGLLVVVVMLIGFLVKLQLDQYFTSGG